MKDRINGPDQDPLSRLLLRLSTRGRGRGRERDPRRRGGGPVLGAPGRVVADLDRRLLAALLPWLRDEFAFARVLDRALGGDPRQTAIFEEVGLCLVEMRSSRGVEDHLFA